MATGHLGLSVPNLVRGGILNVRRNSPIESGRVFDQPIPIAPELIRDGHGRCGSSRNSSSENGVDIGDVEVQRDWPIALRDWWCTHFRKVIVEHQVGVADPDMRMHQLVPGPRRPRYFNGVKRPFQKIDVFLRAVNGEMRSQSSETFRNWTFRFWHSSLIVNKSEPRFNYDKRSSWHPEHRQFQSTCGILIYK